MKCKLKATIHLKDGTVISHWPGRPAREIDVRVVNDRPTIAVLSVGGREIKIASLRLYKYFSEYEKFSLEEIEHDSSTCPSLTGDLVEPDGWDSDGFPSMLLAAGMI